MGTIAGFLIWRPLIPVYEDYELLFTVSRRVANRLRDSWAVAFPGIKLSEVGTLVDGVAEDLPGGWDHFGG